jgi:hypothetical protein
LAELDPQDETKWGRDCDNDEDRAITMIITVKDSGEQLYRRTASCGRWNETNRTFVIEQTGGEFVVSDGIGTPTS